MTLKHGGGRPRGPGSVINQAEQWGISEKAARRIMKLKLNDELTAILIGDARRLAVTQRDKAHASGKYPGGMRALGMASRIPAQESRT